MGISHQKCRGLPSPPSWGSGGQEEVPKESRVLNRFGESWPEMRRKPGTDTNFRRSLPEIGCLFECISMVLSGSPEGYNAENGFCEPAQKPQSGESNEHQTLYRIRRSQEKHQLLRQDRRRQDHRRGQTAGHAPGAAGMGAEAHGTLARGDGSDAIQQLDLRRARSEEHTSELQSRQYLV